MPEKKEDEEIPLALEKLDQDAKSKGLTINVQDYLPEKIDNQEVLESRWMQNVLRDLHYVNKLADTLDQEEKEDLRNYLYRKHSGAHTDAALICEGARCPLISDCWLERRNKTLPKGERCPIETDLLSASMIKYAAELDIRDGSFVDQQICSELAVLDLYERRMYIILGTGDHQGLVIESATGEYDDEGNPITGKHIAHEFEIQDKIKYRRDKVYKSIVATRYEGYRRDMALKKVVDDVSSITSAAKQDFDRLVDEVKRKK